MYSHSVLLHKKQRVIKVRLRWLGAVLQYPCKLIVFLSSLNISTRVTYDKVAKE